MTAHTKTCGWCEAVIQDGVASVRQELEQAQVLIDKLTAERNNARLVAQANKETADAWKQRYLALMAETRELRQAAEAWE